MFNVTPLRHFLPDVHMRITSKFQDSLKTYRLSAIKLFVCGVETHFLTLIVVDSIKLSTESSPRRKQPASSVEALRHKTATYLWFEIIGV